MNTKLTLSIDKEVIDQAKSYVKEEGQSLSKVVEKYLRNLVSRPKMTEREKAFKRLEKRIKNRKPVEPDINYDELKYQYLKEKHNL